ncbi:ATP-binding protein [Marivivens sp. LCG002]|uniref:NACHT domain-containing protein n=1 Tax=Marivivens sp. LCG002 TaxID=3051171 RepID=UPI002555ADF0|nr:ATP-binding protein [Marivivens sp. LCG002]WIV49780.1 ATP-binding protein [Marivivens sp. LCG002]
MDFSKINDFGRGQTDSFEDLLKVLARREKVDDAVEFQPNDGRGGDGGVEALWLLNDGSKVGYQSKFFSSLEDAQWRQMDKSVTQALATHPELVKYIFALPFDLTPNRGPKARGKSQQKKWDDHVAKWKADAAKLSITLEFELWGMTALADKLMAEGNGPLCEHWFGEQVLDNRWFQNQVSSATLKLDDRFNPDDHVEVSIEDLFDAIVRGPETRRTLNDAIDGLTKNRVPNIEFTTTEIVPDQDLLQEMQTDWETLTSSKPMVQFTPGTIWTWAVLVDVASRLSSNTSKVQRLFYSIDKEAQNEADKRKVEVVSHSLRELSSAVYEIRDTLAGKGLIAEAQQCALVLGEAGSGKSHVLGQIASKRVEQDLPTVLVLGHDFGDAPFWTQLGQLLGINGNSAVEILGLLNAVGERLGARTLILIDAINEGVGAHYWKHWLPTVVASIQSYPYLAAVVSCRDVYADYAIPKALQESLPMYRIQGFHTPEERERAAIQYLDKKGISRPNTPWLSPEFSNPLFLKSTSEALAAKGATEFPRGLNGVSQLMALYLDSFSTRMGVPTATSDEISRSLKRLVSAISLQMADDGQDFLAVDRANEIIANIIGNRSAPEGKTWLDVFIQTNLFRRDPPPYSEDDNPLFPPADLVRFSFQRFQDYLMADALVNKVLALSSDDDPSSAFAPSGPLGFLFYENDVGKCVRHQFAGLVAALSTIYPERVGTEFVLSLPNWEKHWLQDHPFQPAFAESFKWRQIDAFSDDTRTLLNGLDSGYVETLELLLEVSMTSGHPYNAHRLHDCLKRLPLAKRDSYWTQWINYSSREELSQIDRIVSWSLSAADENSDPRHVDLAAIVLTWSLSSSHMTLRDRATKALTSVFLRHGGVFETLLQKMQDCDDPYIIERLYAAAFGACCNDPEAGRLSSYSQLVYDAAFASGKPPVALLTRDYALGIIELAEFHGSTGSSVELNRCYHPFSTEPPLFGLTEGEVESTAKASGDEKIFRSAGSEWGDYGKHSIPRRVRDFLTTPLSEPAPKSKAELKQICYDEIVAGHQDRVDALEAYEEATRFPVEFVIRVVPSGEFLDESEPERSEEENHRDALRTSFEDLLTDDDRRKMSEVYFRDGLSNEDYERVNIQQCRWWIVKRAYELGWTKELFPRDGHGGGYSRHHNDLERIGKKYQRIALDELQARLADNYWSIQGWNSGPALYRHSHHDFRRNLEPTVLPNNPCLEKYLREADAWIIEPRIEIPEVSEVELLDWPMQHDPAASAVDIIRRHSPDGRDWLVLYDHVHDRDTYEETGRFSHNLRIEEFRFFQCVLVPRGKAENLAVHLQQQQEIDVWSFKPTEYVDGPYIGEAFWRDTWETTKFTDDIWKTPDDCPIAIPVASYQWESHLDKTLPDGLSTYLPQRWFAEELGLVKRSEDFRSWMRESGEEVFRVFMGGEDHQSGVVIDANVFDEYLAAHELEAIWLFIAERSAWPNGDNEQASRPRFEAAIWRDEKGWKSLKWVRDT